MQLMNRNKNRWMYIHVCLPSHDPLEDPVSTATTLSLMIQRKDEYTLHIVDFVIFLHTKTGLV